MGPMAAKLVELLFTEQVLLALLILLSLSDKGGQWLPVWLKAGCWVMAFGPPLLQMPVAEDGELNKTTVANVAKQEGTRSLAVL